MKNCLLYHLNADTSGDPTWNPGVSPELRQVFEKITKGSLSGKAGGKVAEDWKVNDQYVDTPDKGVVGIPFVVGYVEKAAFESTVEWRRAESRGPGLSRPARVVKFRGVSSW